MTEMDTKGLEKLIRIFGKKTPTVRVGVLKDNNSRSDGEQGNAEIGAKHEFGDEGLPIRSWLRMPLNDKLFDELKSSGMFTEDAVEEAVASGDLIPWMEKIGITATGVIIDAFESGGFGKWQKSIMKFKKNKQTLVETQQLRDSVTHEVVK